MFTPTPEAMKAAEKSLEKSGAIFYHDWPHYQWAARGGKMLTQEQVDALCLAHLMAAYEGELVVRAESAAPLETAGQTQPASQPEPPVAPAAAGGKKKRGRPKRPVKPGSSSPPERDKSRGGRPKLPQGEKLVCISTLVSAARHAELHARAEELGITVSQHVRPLVEPQARLGRRGRTRRRGGELRVAERLQRRQLADLSGSLRQLASCAQKAGYEEVAADLYQQAAAVRTLLAR